MSEEKPAQEACTVSQAMNIAKRGLESIFLTVVGEVSEFSDKPGYKAIYFTIRDDNCAMLLRLLGRGTPRLGRLISMLASGRNSSQLSRPAHVQS